MHVIIPASDIDVSICPLSKPISKTMVPINGKPVLQYILDELYSYMEFIDEIVIAKKNCDDVKEYVCNTSNIDNLFRERIHIVETNPVSQKAGEEYSFMDDFYSGMEHLVDKVCAPKRPILLWRGDVLATDTRKMTDMYLSSFACADSNMQSVPIYKFENFVLAVNINVRQHNLKPTGAVFTINDFIDEYKASGEDFTILTDFGNYHYWQDRGSFYKVQSEFIQNDEHSKLNITIDYVKQQITKKNKFADMDYTRDIWEKSRIVQSLLFAESSALDLADSEQKIFLPELIETGITQAGDYLNELTEEYFPGTSLSSLLTDQDVTDENWKSIIDNIISVVKDVFHKEKLDYYDISNDIVEPKIRNEYNEDIKNDIIMAVKKAASMFSKNNLETYYYVLDNQEITEWNMFADMLCEDTIELMSPSNLFYQGSLNRMCHGNLSFENIIYNTFENSMHFINPVIMKYRLTWSMLDYAYLYYSLTTGVYAIKKGMYTIDNDGNITLTSKAFDTALTCEQILDYYFTKKEAYFLKRYALIILLNKITHNEFKPEVSTALIKYANKTISSIYISNIIG